MAADVSQAWPGPDDVEAGQIPGSSRRPLVIGYGNTLRGDDGVGQCVAQLLAEDPRAAHVDVVAAHQLLPEHAVHLFEASRTVVVDAVVGDTSAAAPLGGCSVDTAPGTCRIRRMGPREGAPRALGSHHCTPEDLAGVARELYGAVGPVTLVGVRVSSTADADVLTPLVHRALDGIVDVVLDVLGGP